MSLQVRRIASLSVLLPLRAQWEALAAGQPFRSFDWLTCWWQHYGPKEGPRSTLTTTGKDLYVLACFDGEQLVGLAPWYRSLTPYGRVLRALGSGEVCSDYLGLLCLPGQEAEVATALACFLSEARSAGSPLLRPDSWDLLLLTGQDADDLALLQLCQKLRAGGHSVAQRAGARTWRISLPTPESPAPLLPNAPLPLGVVEVLPPEAEHRWEAYLATLSASHRSRIRRALRRAEGLELQLVETEGERALALQTLYQLHQQRRLQVGEPGAFASPRNRAFHEAVTQKLLAAGRLRLLVLSQAGRPVGALYALAGGGVLYGYQSGLDPQAMSLEPGRILHASMILRALHEGATAYDLLRGDEPYKAHFRAEPVASCELLIAHRHLTGRLFFAAVQGGRWLKAWASQLRGQLRTRTVVQS